MQPRTYHVITFGCQMNVHDSAWLGAALEARGFAPAELTDAEVVVINTCSVREKPEQKVMSALGRVRQATGGDARVLVAVAGCVAQQLGAELFDRSPQVRLVAGSDGLTEAPDAIERLLAEPEARLALCAFTEAFPEKEAAPRRCSGPSALVTIMQGCDNFCAYCIVPFTRGRQKSRATYPSLRNAASASTRAQSRSPCSGKTSMPSAATGRATARASSACSNRWRRCRD